MGSMVFSSKRERWQELEELKDDAHVAAAPQSPLAFGHLVDIPPADNHLARGGVIDPGQHIQQRGLATARLADQGHKLPVAHLQVDALQGGELAGGVYVGLDHIAQDDGRILRFQSRCLHHGSVVRLAIARRPRRALDRFQDGRSTVSSRGGRLDGLNILARFPGYHKAALFVAVHKLTIGYVHPPGKARGQAVVVRDHDDGLALCHQRLKDLKNRLRSHRVQVARRLVGNDDRRVVHQSSGNGDTLLLAAGGMGRQLVGVLQQFDPVQQFQRMRLADSGPGRCPQSPGAA